MTEQLTVEAVYFAALALPDSERPAYLEKVCGDHEALRQCVEKMLAVQPMVGNFLEAGVNLPVTSDSEASGQTVDFGDPTARVDSILVGKYKLIEEIGAGGMGSVYMAQQTQPVKRTVAVKVIKAGMDSKAVLARFEAERQALAMMDHPNIARVLDAGTTDGGRPFFVMELVKGFPITQFCDDRKLTLRQRLELFVPVCQAIQHAHQKGIVHRDIKPSNVLVALYDDRAVPKVIDFGVAKAAGQSLTDLTLVTGFGAIIGTPEYMSPEQASLNNLDIDTRSDVYSLGVLLYELMTGSTPVDRKSLGKAAMLEILRIVREVEIPLASVRLSNRDTLVGVAANRGTEPAKLSRLMRGELDWLLHKALEKDRTRRYETANGLARDIQRYLADEILEARPPPTSYRVRKFIRRNPLQLALAGAIGLLMVGGTAVAWWQNEQANQQTAKDLRQQLVDQQRIATDNARLARNSEAVAGLLVQTAEALRAGDTVRADITLEAAKKRSTEGGAEEHLKRLGRLEADLFLIRDLEAIDQFRWTVVDNKIPSAEAITMRVRDILKGRGADLQTASLDDLEAWVKASGVPDRILSALYLALKKGPDQTGWSLLRRVDTDPFRNAVRDSILANNPKRTLQLAQQTEALNQPPEFASFLAKLMIIPIDLRRRLLLSALNQRPDDLDLLMTMGQTTRNNEVLKNRYNPQEETDWQLRWYQAAVAARPRSAAARNNLGCAFLGKKQYDEAVFVFKKTLELDPNFVGTHMNLATVLNYQGQPKEAFALLNRAIELDPKNYDIRYNLGSILMANNQYDEAIAGFVQAIVINPKGWEAHTGLGIALASIGKNDEAIISLKKAIEFNPQSSNAHNALGVLLCNYKHDYPAARDCFVRAIELDSKNPTQRCNLGNTLLAINQVDLAVDSYKKALELDPKLVATHISLGKIYFSRKKDFDEAIACFNTALKLDPRNTNARNGLKIALMSRSIELTGKNRLDEALADIRQAIQLDPNDGLAHCVLGDVFNRKRQMDEAIGCYEKAFQLDPKLPDARMRLYAGLRDQGNFLSHEKKDFDGAILLIKKAIELEPKDISAYPYLGRALKGKGRPNEAQTYYLQFAQQDPRNPTHLNDLATALKSQGQFDDALIWFQKTTELDPMNAGALSNLACCAVMEASREVSSEGKPDAEEHVRLRNKAITALNTAKGLYAKQLETGKPDEHAAALKELIHWREGVLLEAVRNADALSKLQEEERKKWQAFWAELDSLLAKPKGK